MGIFDKLAFWKKEDDFGFDELAQKEFHAATQGDNLGLEEKSPFQDQATQTGPSGLEPLQQPFSSPPSPPPMPSAGLGAQVQAGSSEIELVNSKLDTIKAMLTSIEQRISNIEKMAGAEQKPQQRLW